MQGKNKNSEIDNSAKKSKKIKLTANSTDWIKRKLER